MKSTRYDSHLFPSTVERFKRLRKALKKQGTKITMTKIFALLNDYKENERWKRRKRMYIFPS